ncbi:ATP phosphoribosyltransferase regulatory subunit [Entomobacter blattae]|uniref:ATP phosphoribosyltransferase regulatory subunit n=1 Tax=Entomobacter blattae TaxID=2762277 RepID=A0A7H1NT91_9PROT|nr:ATP phosphoribosyltransferase regulatory subunit [Entomobacter blattae]QNT79001.1 ATP phosphoribosyltransferase regulatory subunit [Entomobacter blattae]
MTDNDYPFNPALLPAGFVDLLPPDAQAEARNLARLMQLFHVCGYERVKPALFEFEESLLSGSGEVVAEQAFRVMDPDSHRTMVVRPDITPQISRLASTRLINASRPLRLSYAGPCVLLKGGHSVTRREIVQAGIELIGPDSPGADAEIVAIGLEALTELGIEHLSFDLTLPLLTPLIVEKAGYDEKDKKRLLKALDRKDAAAVEQVGGHAASILTTLLHAAGEVDDAFRLVSAVELPIEGKQMLARLKETVQAIRRLVPHIHLTLDPVEFRGWKYHTGFSFSIYSLGYKDELGRGGRYVSNNEESACGLTLRPDILNEIIPSPPREKKLFLPFHTPVEQAREFRRQGIITVMALKEGAEEDQAFQANCSHILQDGAIHPLKTK